ncbi:type II secretion system protein [Terribacillus saccharophilus]|uniref:type II secretion system protein n=1 Tax=Terribacillus saccharophilus TaxID=361277 RepID=UPI003D293514
MKEQHGFTLLEILVSITILAIVIIAFIPIFTQAAIHNRVNGETLRSNEAAQVVAAKFETLLDIQKIIGNTASLVECSSQPVPKAVPFPEVERVGDTNYEVNVSLCDYNEGNVTGLTQAIFSVKNTENSPVSEGTAIKFLSNEEGTNAQTP